MTTTYGYEPTLPTGAPNTVSQQISLQGDDGDTIGTADWVSWPHQPGIAQILDIQIDEDLRRAGHGTRLLEELVRQAESACRPLRRIVAMINQPDTITRAFLQRRGFVHIHTLPDLGEGEIEVMCFVRTFD